MKLMNIHTSLLLLGWSAAMTQACSFTTYTNKAAWEAAVGSVIREEFDNEPVTPSPVQSLTFTSGITGTVTGGASDSPGDLGILAPGSLKMRVAPGRTTDPTQITFTLPSSTRGIGLDLSSVNRNTVLTWVKARVGDTEFDMSDFLNYGSSGGGSGFFGIETTDSSCSFDTFDLFPMDNGNGGLDDFTAGSINYIEAGRDGAGMGDPHFMTWNGAWYDFHGECDLVFLSNPRFDNGKGMDIYIRTKLRREYSYIESAALRIGDDVLEVSSWGEYRLNGVEGAKLADNAELELVGGKTIGSFPIVHQETDTNAKANKFEVRISPTETITLGNFKDMVSVKIQGAGSKNFGAAVGLMGSFATGDMMSRDGNTIMTDDPNAFGQEWQKRLDEPNLFEAAPQNPLQKCILPEAQTGRRRLGETLARDAAEKACAHLGAKQRDLCVYDVMATGDLDVAKAFH